MDKDPIIDACKTVVRDEGLNNNQAAVISGVAPATLANWFDGETRRPNNATVTALTSALGYVRSDSINAKTGRVEVGFKRVKVSDWKEEREKALKFRDAQEAKTNKKNGHAK
jgi:hypothetical protein